MFNVPETPVPLPFRYIPENGKPFYVVVWRNNTHVDYKKWIGFLMGSSFEKIVDYLRVNYGNGWNLRQDIIDPARFFFQDQTLGGDSEFYILKVKHFERSMLDDMEIL